MKSVNFTVEVKNNVGTSISTQFTETPSAVHRMLVEVAHKREPVFFVHSQAAALAVLAYVKSDRMKNDLEGLKMKKFSVDDFLLSIREF